ncbi:MAG: hypothetical protein ACK5SX_15855 [Sandaracinobacter sp.]
MGDAMLTDVLLGWALLATVAAAWAWWRLDHWKRSYLASLRLIPALHLHSKTPHQRGAETRKARELARKRAHREDMQRSMMERADV